MILFMMGIADILVGLALLFPGLLPSASYALGCAALIKALVSFLMSFSVGYYLDLFGFLDLLAGVSLVFSFSLPALWLLLMLKGLASLFA